MEISSFSKNLVLLLPTMQMLWYLSMLAWCSLQLLAWSYDLLHSLLFNSTHTHTSSSSSSFFLNLQPELTSVTQPEAVHPSGVSKHLTTFSQFTKPVNRLWRVKICVPFQTQYLRTLKRNWSQWYLSLVNENKYEYPIGPTQWNVSMYQCFWWSYVMWLLLLPILSLLSWLVWQRQIFSR